MPTDEIKIEEYKSLLADTRLHMKLIPEILAFMVVATSALLGYGIKNENAIICLTPLLVLCPCAYLIGEQMKEVLRKGAYIKGQYEQTEQLWQNTLYEFRQLREEGENNLFTKAAGDSRAIVIIINCLVVLCFIVFISCPFSQINDLKMIFGVVGAIVILFVIDVLPKFPVREILSAYTSEREEYFLNIFFSSKEKQREIKKKRRVQEKKEQKLAILSFLPILILSIVAVLLTSKWVVVIEIAYVVGLILYLTYAKDWFLDYIQKGKQEKV